ncbi:MAG: Rrf2 family transcriptional regulator, partial [Deltaproteobacteria bacterium]|nr:Rrf2 family transcriptional regulator [Deltaproteobacteria bacterium]
AVVRTTETNLALVECFDPATNTCPIAPACGLKRALWDARNQFLATLDKYTLADVAGHPQQLVQLWTASRNTR